MTSLAHHLTQILGRIEATTQQAATYCCATCGCLCRRGESCPACALPNATKETA